MAIVKVEELSFCYPTGNIAGTHSPRQALLIERLSVSRGERVVVCGPNGAGKSTLLSILGGKRLVRGRSALVLDRECFNDCSLGKEVCVLNDWWKNNFFLDVPVRDFLGERVSTSQRCFELCQILQIDLNWRISQLSDGQRRRCQLLAGVTFSEEFKIYILDEVTSDLDIISRERFLSWLKTESTCRGATVIYSTHIFEGLNEWATRLIYMDEGLVKRDMVVDESTDIFRLVRGWMLRKCESLDG
jgi:CCR4-NOT complex subunit CAF16